MSDQDKDLEQEMIENEQTDDAPDMNKDDKDGYEDICYICRRPESKAGKMIKIPNNVCICRDCMQKTFDSMSGSGFNLGDFNPANMGFGNMPNISMINLSDLQGMLPRNQQVKKKKPKEKKEKPVLDIHAIPAPHKIKASLDEYIVGQDYAKKVMSVAVYNHYKRVASEANDDIEIEKSNMLMVGPTGSGKTYMVRTLAKLLDVPLAITDATSLTEAGYIGDDIESVVSKLLAPADNDIEKAERGIIFIDEIDKIAKKRNTNQRDVSGESVQQGMLKLLEGADVEVPVGASSKNAMVPMVTVNTRNILFICGGAFEGLDSVIKKRTESSSLGFGGKVKSKEDDNNIMKRVVPHDLVKFGIVPELVGRLPVITVLDELDEDALCRILTEPKNSLIKQYTKLFKLDNIDFEITEDAKREIAKRTIEEKTGARGLRAIVEKILTKLMFEAPSDDEIVGIKITAECVRGEAEPEITRAVSSARKKK